LRRREGRLWLRKKDWARRCAVWRMRRKDYKIGLARKKRRERTMKGLLER
jgi:hypothetical protein